MNQIKTVLFDLDGTLLPVDMKQFLSIYFEEMGKQFSEHIDPETLTQCVWKATSDLIENNEKRTNAEVFWDSFKKMTGNHPELAQEKFAPFYDGNYKKTKVATYPNIAMQKAVAHLLEKGIKVIVATNPLFPECAVHDRIRWAGLNPEDFSYISSLEKNCHCKPNIAFYDEIVDHQNLNPLECLMVGNDAKEDMVAKELGMTTYLVTDHLINHGDEPIVADHIGTSEDFLEFIQKSELLS
jgi:FMN phosphatase YigB (HAD superfamily)